MQSIINKIKENSVDRIVEVFWVSIKAAVITTIILLLLQIYPIKHTGYIRLRHGYVDVSVDGSVRVDGSVGVGQIGSWDVDTR